MSENNKTSENGNDKHERGRPHDVRRAEIEREIWSYFVIGVYPSTVAVQTGYNIKTIRHYYKNFSSFRINLNQNGFIQQCKINIENALAAIDNQILRLEDLYAVQKKYLDTFGHELSLNSAVDGLRKIIKTTSELQTLKLTIANSPTADINLMRLTQEILKNHDTSLVN